MKHRTVFFIVRICVILTAFCLLLTGCGCKHAWVEAGCETPKTCSVCNEIEGEALGHTWQDADCENPKTCSTCKKTEGDALGHTWQDADCENPKTCSTCKKTEGDALGHTWQDADCENPKTCTTCSKTDGNALGHNWAAATCEKPKTCTTCSKTDGNALGHRWADATTEAPKTCSACKQTEGSRIVTDSRFKTAACKALFGTWKGTIKIPGSDIIADDFAGTLELEYAITFHNNGNYSEKVVVLNEDSFNKQTETYYVDTLYAEFAANGMTQEQADAAMQQTYGMDVKTYAKMASVAVDWDAMFAAAIPTGVYYVANEKLYSGASWDAQLISDSYTVSNNSLTIESLSADFPGLVMTRVSG